jgi:hypothetical protein
MHSLRLQHTGYAAQKFYETAAERLVICQLIAHHFKRILNYSLLIMM